MAAERTKETILRDFNDILMMKIETLCDEKSSSYIIKSAIDEYIKTHGKDDFEKIGNRELYLLSASLGLCSENKADYNVDESVRKDMRKFLKEIQVLFN